MRNPRVPEDFLLECFIGGLKEEIGETVKMYEPYSLSQAVSFARKQERIINARERKAKWMHKGTIVPFNKEPVKNIKLPRKGPEANARPEIKPEFRRIHGACWRCGERYHPRHVCKDKQLNAMSVVEEEQQGEGAQEERQLALTVEEEVTQEMMEGEEEAVCLNAMSCTPEPNTFKLKGFIKKRAVIILVDYGSTHSFLDSQTAKELGLVAQMDRLLRVTVANGQQMYSHQSVTVKWKASGVEFTDKFRLLNIGSCDMVLGGDWMRAHSPVTFDYELYVLKLQQAGKMVTLKGELGHGKMHQITTKGVVRILRKGQALLAHFFTMVSQEIVEDEEIPTEVQGVLTAYAEVFKELKALPPTREHDHAIPIIPGVKPVSLRPYRSK
ncbi:uncharacterized protein LOC132034339 [Lycium ferocissimum]|uniref:uncharacterized protein LOC132034339 n=1 Tax=Lycium ferocissimum TaxID=112874 RepID=UPI0028167BFB|nr:uncharacterized protein LOC132034339 [Lycium ferocissimum]